MSVILKKVHNLEKFIEYEKVHQIYTKGSLNLILFNQFEKKWIWEMFFVLEKKILYLFQSSKIWKKFLNFEKIFTNLKNSSRILINVLRFWKKNSSLMNKKSMNLKGIHVFRKKGKEKVKGRK